MTKARSAPAPQSSESWPELRLADWKDTYATLHMWTQIVGKILLELTPRVNHWWNVPLYVSPRGLSTSIIPYGPRYFEMEFDFLEHKLFIRTTDPKTVHVALATRSVADFYSELMAALRAPDIEVRIWKTLYLPLGAKRLPRLADPLHQNPGIQNRQGCRDIRVDLK